MLAPLDGWGGRDARGPRVPPRVALGPRVPLRKDLAFSGALVVGASSLAVTVPCDPALIGQTVAIQGADAPSPGGCAGSPAFRVSNTIRSTIQ